MKIEFLLPSAAREARRRVQLGQLGANLGQLSANLWCQVTRGTTAPEYRLGPEKPAGNAGCKAGPGRITAALGAAGVEGI